MRKFQEVIPTRAAAFRVAVNCFQCFSHSLATLFTLNWMRRGRGGARFLKFQVFCCLKFGSNIFKSVRKQRSLPLSENVYRTIYILSRCCSFPFQYLSFLPAFLFFVASLFCLSARVSHYCLPVLLASKDFQLSKMASTVPDIPPQPSRGHISFADFISKRQ